MDRRVPARCGHWWTALTPCAARWAKARANLARGAQPWLTDLVRDVPWPRPPDTLRLQPGITDHIHDTDDLEFRVVRWLFDTLAAAGDPVDEGFDVRGGALAPGTVANGWPSTPATGAEAG